MEFVRQLTWWPGMSQTAKRLECMHQLALGAYSALASKRLGVRAPAYAWAGLVAVYEEAWRSCASLRWGLACC